MKSKTWLRLFYAAAIAAILTIGTFAQTRTNQIYRPCAGSATPASVRVLSTGAISVNPCSGQTSTFTAASSASTPLSLQLASGQTFDAFSILPFGSSTALFKVNSAGLLLIGGIDNNRYIRIGTNFANGGSGSQAIEATGAGASDLWLSNDTGGVINFRANFSTIAKIRGDTNTFSSFKGADVASAAAITPTGNLFHITGVAAITSITSTNITAGTCITLIFDSTATLTDGSNIKAAGNLVATADDTWSGCYDGTNWYETARAIN